MVIQPGGTSVGQALTGSALTATAIPTLDTGERPKWVHVNSSTGMVSIIFGQSGVATATVTNGIGVAAFGPGAIINVAGQTHYSVILTVGTATTLTMTPLAGVFASR